jgi:2-iminobutanoate/2-iminopropanoate deaminase
MIERLIPAGIPEPKYPYVPVVRAGDFLFVSGQVPTDYATGQISLGTIQHETRIVLGNVQKILEGAGASMADVVRCNVYLRQPDDFSGMNEVYQEFFGANKPARTTVAVLFAHPEMRVEIDCIAYKPR